MTMRAETPTLKARTSIKTPALGIDSDALGTAHGDARASRPKVKLRAMTPAERSFWWAVLRHVKLRDRICRFQWIGGELAEFICHETRLVIEIVPTDDCDESARLAREARLRPARYALLQIPARHVLRAVHVECERLVAMLDLMIAGSGGGSGKGRKLRR